MAATEALYKEVLQGSQTNSSLIIRYSYHGIPTTLRPMGWKFLLQILAKAPNKPDQSSSIGTINNSHSLSEKTRLPLYLRPNEGLERSMSLNSIYPMKQRATTPNTPTDTTQKFDFLNVDSTLEQLSDRTILLLRNEVDKFVANRYREAKVDAGVLKKKMNNLLTDVIAAPAPANSSTSKKRSFSVLVRKVFRDIFQNDRDNSSNIVGIVHILGILCLVLWKSSQSTIQLSFQTLLVALYDKGFLRKEVLLDTLGKFLMRLRSFCPDLYAHLEDQEINQSAWANSWLRYLLCKELPLETCFRLWDAYLAIASKGFQLHIFVCLAIIKSHEEDLLLMKRNKLLSFFSHLPQFDMDRIISRARYLFESVDFEQM